MSEYLDSLKTYIGFTEEDTKRLQELADPAQPYFAGFSEHFYERIAAHPDAHKVFEDPEQIERLKLTLIAWMESGLAGPHDHAFYKRRARIGRVHVRIGLPQQYMFTAMNVMRLDFHHMIAELHRDDDSQGAAARERLVHDSLDKLFDLELAIMLRTYQADSEERMRRNERLATIGQLAASIGHDLRNPLSVIQSSLYILQRYVREDSRAIRHTGRIQQQVSLCDSIIGNLLLLARNRPPRRSLIDFREVFDKAMSPLTLPQDISVTLDVQPGVQFYGDAGLLSQALTNLIDNAVKAYQGQPGEIVVSVNENGDGHVIIEVADNGPGFSVETITKVFEPLVTTRDNGIGLGLALVKGIVERHGGTVNAFNRPAGGAAVRIRLPLTDEPDMGLTSSRDPSAEKGIP